MHDTFEWWSGIFLPAIVAITTLSLGVVSLMVALVALRVARSASVSVIVADRRVRAERLILLANRVQRGFMYHEVDPGLVHDALEELNRTSTASDEAWKRLAAHLLGMAQEDMSKWSRMDDAVALVHVTNDIIPRIREYPTAEPEWLPEIPPLSDAQREFERAKSTH